MKTSALTGAALDWAVAKAEGKDFFIEGKAVLSFCPGADIPGVPYFDREYWMPSVKWSQGGPIIERERIEIQKGNPLYFPEGNENGDYYEPLWIAGKMHGQTPLIAAMRCYVVSKMGNEIEVPEELQ